MDPICVSRTDHDLDGSGGVGGRRKADHDVGACPSRRACGSIDAGAHRENLSDVGYLHRQGDRQHAIRVSSSEAGFGKMRVLPNW